VEALRSAQNHDPDPRPCASIGTTGAAQRRRMEGPAMSHHVYRLSEIVGSSETGVDDAIRTAVRKAAETVRNIEWFETTSVRGHVVDGEVAHVQVTLKIGFRVE
jgi:dodecin